MTQRIAMALSCLIVCGGLLWLLVGGLGVEELRLGSENTESLSPESAKLLAGARARIEVDAPSEVHDRQRIAVPVMSDAKPQDSLLVRVRRNGDLVADAEVLYATFIDPAVLEPKMRDRLLGLAPDMEAILRRIGKATRTDSKGAARVPRPLLPMSDHFMGTSTRSFAMNPHRFIVARSGEGLGYAWIGKGQSPLEIELLPDHGFDVRVSNMQGEPAEGVRIAWEHAVDGSQAPRFLELGLTDGSGLLRIVHSQALAMGRSWSSSRVLVHEPGILLEPVPMDFLDPGDRSIEFRLPPTGSIAVAVVDEDHKPLQRDGTVYLTEPGQMESVDGIKYTGSFPLSRQRYSLDAGDGRFCFRYVGLGRRFEVGGHVGTRLELRKIPGPDVPGQRVDLEISFDAHPKIAGRLLDSQGQAVAGKAYGLSLRIDRRWFHKNGKTDPAGRFSNTLKTGFMGKTVTAMRVRQSDGQERGLELMQHRSFLIGARVDLGDLRLEEPPLIAQAYVVDDAGHAVETCTVRAGSVDPSLSCATVKEDGGRYKVYSGAKATNYYLRVFSAQHENKQVRFVAGDRIRVTLHRTGRLHARVHHAPGFPWRELDLTLIQSDDPKARLSYPRKSHANQWIDFEWPKLPVGVFQIELRLVGEPDPIVSVPNVLVNVGDNKDPRLEKIDVMDLVRAIRIRLLQEDGSPFESSRQGELFIQSREDARRYVGVRFRTSMPIVLTRGVPRNVLLSVSGYKVVRLQKLVEDVDVRLAPVESVPVVFDFPRDADLARTSVRVRMLPRAVSGESFVVGDEKPRGAPLWLNSVTFDPTSKRLQKLSLLGPGEYSVSLEVWTGQEFVDVSRFSPRSFKVQASNPGQTVTIKTTAEVLRAAITRKRDR